MAPTRFIFTCFVVLFTPLEIQFTDGRNLMTTANGKHSPGVEHSLMSATNVPSALPPTASRYTPNVQHVDEGSPENDHQDKPISGFKPTTTKDSFPVPKDSINGVEAFRPTAPGHSPGAGHGSPPPEPQVSIDADAFRPTAPGHSPGAGHGSPPPEPQVSIGVDAFSRATARGHSPGIGHGLPPPEPQVSIGVDAFRPTAPGHSPGAGHGSPPPEPQVSIGVDAFRPTAPGHSPGAGHGSPPPVQGLDMVQHNLNN